jgi:hypothetical protein
MSNDLVISNGTVIAGTGGAARRADVAVTAGRITEVGTVDGQATWAERMVPSSWHGVTTVVTGNCGGRHRRDGPPGRRGDRGGSAGVHNLADRQPPDQPRRADPDPHRVGRPAPPRRPSACSTAAQRLRRRRPRRAGPRRPGRRRAAGRPAGQDRESRERGRPAAARRGGPGGDRRRDTEGGAGVADAPRRLAPDQLADPSSRPGVRSQTPAPTAAENTRSVLSRSSASPWWSGRREL